MLVSFIKQLLHKFSGHLIEADCAPAYGNYGSSFNPSHAWVRLFRRFILFRLFRLEYPDGSSVKTERGNRETAFSTIKTSMPTAIRSSLWPIGNSFLFAAINAAGTSTIAAFSICNKLMLLLWLSIDSLGPSVTTFVAQNYGAGDLERARKGTRVGLFTGLVMMGLYSVVLYFHGAWIGQIFLDSKSRDVLLIVDQILKMWAPFLCVYTFGSIFTGATSGYGDTVGPMFIILLCTCGFRIVWASTYCTAHPGMVGIILAYVLAYFLTGGVAMAYYFLVTRRRLRKAQTVS
jgi:Na+-driven multidrug efflux pump